MQLLFSYASPFSSKVRMAIRYLNLDVDEVEVQTSANPPILIGNNPLGKIPTLLTKEGSAVFDSRSIMRFLDRLTSKNLYPVDEIERGKIDIIEALCDGVCDSLLRETLSPLGNDVPALD